MSVTMSRTAVVLLTSGLSRRYGGKDKMLADLAGQPLVEHAAHAIAQLEPLARVAVCPSERPQIGERLINRFVIAVNKKPKLGLGHSIAVGVNVALQFKPDAILLAMGDMPFMEPWVFEGVLGRLTDGVDIVHAGAADRPHPPTAFGPATFDALAALDGDDGAKRIIGQGGFNVVAFNAPTPLLLDVDTREDLELAQHQFRIRKRYAVAGAAVDQPLQASRSDNPSDAETASIELEEMPVVGRRAGRSNRR